MLTVTITSPTGESITTNNLDIAAARTKRMLEPMTMGEAVKHAAMIRELADGGYLAAAGAARSLQLSIEVEEYFVPVDPADDTICEACS